MSRSKLVREAEAIIDEAVVLLVELKSISGTPREKKNLIDAKVKDLQSVRATVGELGSNRRSLRKLVSEAITEVVRLWLYIRG